MILQIHRILEDCQSMFSSKVPSPSELLQFQNFLILGGGTSGISASKLLLQFEKKTVLLDKNPKSASTEDFSEIHSEDEGIRILPEIDVVIKSPGIKPDHPILAAAIKSKIPILSEIALGRVFYQGTLIGITGTDGKSTTTALVSHILKSRYTNSEMGGNIGVPFTSFCTKKLDLVVLELSSYQLEDSPNLEMDIAAILNLAPDHLERHGTMENYAKAKWKIQNFQNPRFQMFLTRNVLKYLHPNEYENHKDGIHFIGEKEVYHISNNLQAIKTPRDLYDTTNFPLQGKHNLTNLCFAIGIAEKMNVPKEKIINSLQNFLGLKYRYEKINVSNPLPKFKNYHFINDSKSTNLHSLLSGLAGFSPEDNLYLILGGIPKEEPLSPFLKRWKELKNPLWVYGKACEIWREELEKENMPVYFFKTVEETLLDVKFHLISKTENTLSQKPEGTVLFSPACASFDLYKNFEERGLDFETLVLKLFSDEKSL